MLLGPWLGRLGRPSKFHSDFPRRSKSRASGKSPSHRDLRPGVEAPSSWLQRQRHSGWLAITVALARPDAFKYQLPVTRRLRLVMVTVPVTAWQWRPPAGASERLVPYDIIHDFRMFFICIWNRTWYHVYMISYMKCCLWYHSLFLTYDIINMFLYEKCFEIIYEIICNWYPIWFHMSSVWCSIWFVTMVKSTFHMKNILKSYMNSYVYDFLHDVIWIWKHMFWVWVHSWLPPLMTGGQSPNDWRPRLNALPGRFKCGPGPIQMLPCLNQMQALCGSSPTSAWLSSLASKSGCSGSLLHIRCLAH